METGVERLQQELNSYRSRAVTAEEAVHRLTGRLHAAEEQLVPKGAHVSPEEKDAGILRRTLAQKTAEARELAESLEAERRKARHLKDRVFRLEETAVHKLVITNQTVAVGKRPTASKAAVGINALSVSMASGGGGSAQGSSRRGSYSEAPSGGTPGGATLQAATPRSHARGGSAFAPSPAAGAGAPPPGATPGAASAATQAAVTRAIAAEASAATLRAEVEALRAAAARAAAASAAAPPPLATGAPPPPPPPWPSATSPSVTTIAVPRAELMELERALKDKTAQVLLLKSRYEHLEAKAGAERELYDRALAVLEEQNGSIRDARSSLAAAEGGAASMAARARAGEAAAAELAKSREEVRRLERMLTDICASPFVAEGKEAAGRRESAEARERELVSAREALQHLQHTVRAQHAELAAARREVGEVGEAAESAREAAAAAAVSLAAERRANGALRERLALFSGLVGSMGGMEASGDGGGEGSGSGSGSGSSGSVPPEELERALTLVRRRMDAAPGSSSGGGAEGGSSSDALPAAQRKAAALELALVSSAREAERTEALLAAQTSIARDLSAEVAELSARLAGEGSGVRRRLAETEALAERRGQRIGVLEAQVRTLIEELKMEKRAGAAAAAAAAAARSSVLAAASRSQRFGGGERGEGEGEGEEGEGDDDTVISALSGEGGGAGRARAPPLHPDALASSLSAAAAAHPPTPAQAGVEDCDDSALLDCEYGPGENVLEVYLVGARLEGSAVARGDSTFALLEFYDFEAKPTPLAQGSQPCYNFSALYKYALTPFFLAQAARASGGVTLDVYKARAGDSVMLGRAFLPLHRLLSHATRAVYPALPLLSPTTGACAGTLHVELRGALPLEAPWRALCGGRGEEGAVLAAAVAAARDAEDREGQSGGAHDNAARRSGVGAADAGAALAGAQEGGASASAAAAAAGSTPPPSALNSLQLTIRAVTGLAPPARVFVTYAFPSGFPVLPGRTPASAGATANALFSHARAFPCTTTAALLGALGDAPLCCELVEEGSGAVLGRASVSLAALCSQSGGSGGGVAGEFPAPPSAARISLTCGWERGLHLARTPALGIPRTAALALAAWGSGGAGEGVQHGIVGAALGLGEEGWECLARMREMCAGVRGWREALATASGVSAGAGRSGVSAGDVVAALTAAAGAAGGAGGGGGQRPCMHHGMLQAWAAPSLPWQLPTALPLPLAAPHA